MAYNGLKPQVLRQMMKKAKDTAVSFAFGQGADGKDQLALDDGLSPREVLAKFKAETGAAKIAYGTCRVDGSAFAFSAEKTLKDMRSRVVDLAKAEGWPVKQAKVSGGGEDGDVRGLELDTSPSPSPAPSPAPVAPDVPAADEDTPDDVRPPEVIAGASGVQYTSGEVTNRTGKEGGDFSSGARANARENDHRDVGSPYEGGTNAMQSANLGGEFAVRHGVGLLCVKYTAKGLPPLDDIADYAKPNSAYLAGFRGLDQSEQYMDPKSADIVARIQEWVVKTAKAVPAGKQGELVVSFQGHGFNGSIFGVDGGEISSSKLLGIARAAAKARVSVTYVLDGCFTGNAVAGFQEDAAAVVERRADKSGGKKEFVKAVKDVVAFARELVNFSKAVGARSVDMAKAVAKVNHEDSSPAWERLAGINAALARDTASMSAQWQANRAVAESLGLDPKAVDAALSTFASELAARGPGMSFEPEAWVERVGAFQDSVSDAANGLIEEAAAAVKRARG